MTKREAAIISAYTGIMTGSFSELQKYAEEKMNRPVWTHEFGDSDFAQELKVKATDDFINICDNITD